MDKAIPMEVSSGACEATPSSTEAVDALLASELNNMTVADRTNVFEVKFPFRITVLLCASISSFQLL